MTTEDIHLVALCKWFLSWRDRPTVPFQLNKFTAVANEKFWHVADREAQDVVDFYNGDRLIKNPRHTSGGVESTMTDLWLLAGSPTLGLSLRGGKQ